MKVADLEGPLLDYWVSRASGINAYQLPHSENKELVVDIEYAEFGIITYNPSRSWRLAGPIIETNRISVEWTPDGWKASRPSGQRDTYYSVESPLVAAMRCFVASKLGDTVTDTGLQANSGMADNWLKRGPGLSADGMGFH